MSKKDELLMLNPLFYLVIVTIIIFGFSPKEGFAVTVSINSGNPVYPFPQFLAYKNLTSTLDNLATKPGVGVTHAEMEQTIRDGYQIQMNRASKPGGGVGGKDYIKYKSNPQCSEGDGYGLLGAASMADKETFDGMWLYIHDFALNKVKKYSDCKETSPGYQYSQLPGWTGAGANSATDGDVDIALALFTAYLQWGEFMGIDDACGEPISYKKEAINFLKGLTDTLIYSANGNYLCGDVGLDGYIKGGDSWGELTSWASDINVSGFPRKPDASGGTPQHIDYNSPSYFRAFADFLSQEDSAKYAWNIKQFRRGEASSDWLMGKMLDNEKMIPFAGWVSLSSDNTPSYTSFSDGEDFRCAWRTILNEVWYGNPSYTWDPKTHQIKPGVKNSFEQDIGKRYARFLWDGRQDPWNNACTENVGGEDGLGYWGPDILKQYYTPEGKPLGTFPLNWVPGTGSPSAVVSQDHRLMAELYRCLEMKWDSENEERYIKSIPFYFHGWFRMLGLLVLSGNYQAPSEIKPTANMKVYLDIDKTFAFEGDSVTYTIDYRNYGTLDAKDIVITDTLHKDFVYISSTGGGVYNSGLNTVTWKVSSLSGFKTSEDISTTKGQVKLTVKIGIASETQYRNRVSIKCSNGSGWTSNEYPNNITPVMERNYLDIAKRALIIDKKVANNYVNPGKEVEVTVNFQNTSEAGWINGGRPGVHFSYSSAPLSSGKGPSNKMRFRLFHDANEAYIDYGNYRVSYFLFDAGLTCYKNTTDCSNGWELTKQIFEGVAASDAKVLHENITSGQDARGKWNQKIILQFSDVNDPARPTKLTATNYHLDWYRGVTTMIHRGGVDPLRLVWDIHTGTYTDVDWSDDWSWNSDAIDADDESKGFPVTNDWTDLENPNIKITTYNPKECRSTTHTIDNILVEEWDGYTWRRVAGNGPLPGRDAENVIIRDTIPAGLTFSKFTSSTALGVSATVKNNVITWTISKLQVKEKGSIKYLLKADGSCPMQNKTVMTRTWISADKESPVYDSAAITVTCDSIPPAPPEATTMYKTSDKSVYLQGDTVRYQIGYRQTHGTIVTIASDAAEWIDKGGKGKLAMKGDTIVFSTIGAMMVHKYAYGVNGVFGGTLGLSGNDTSSLVARVNGTAFVEIKIKKEWGDMWMEVYDNGKIIGSRQRFSYTNFPNAFNFKIRLAEDTISFWAGDTSSELPNITMAGITVREGHAGVKANKYVEQSKLWGWNSHMDAAFDLSIRDILPSDLTYISSGGSIVTGKMAATQLTGTNTNGKILWNVAGGDNYLSADDSVNIWIKATLDNCSGDTVYNTAYANIRGWQTDYLGARAAIKCASGDEGKPDHIDIILDTASFNRTGDEYIDPITLGSNQQTFVLYAVVRDKYGSFVGFADDAVWTSNNDQAASVKESAGNRWIGTITNIGEGTAVISVKTDAVTKGDSVSVTILTSAAWPSIRSAVMRDNDGDCTPDLLMINLTSDFEDGQRLDSVIIDYKGKNYSIAVSDITKNGMSLSVPFVSMTGTDGAPSGRVTMYMTVDSKDKQNAKSFSDGVGPSIVSASVLENKGDDPDVLTLAFTETVVPSMLIGRQLLLVKAQTTDTIYLDIDKIVSIQSDSLMTIKLVKSGNHPENGDKLRLLPGSYDGKICDLNNNVPHDLNRSVVLTLQLGPAAISRVWYLDTDANGYIDSVKVCFKRSVDISEIMSLDLHWHADPTVRIVAADLTKLKNVDDSTIMLPADGAAVSSKINTSLLMEVSVVFANTPDNSINSAVSDFAAPVVLSAKILPGKNNVDGSRENDTLSVELSEKLAEPFDTDPFMFAGKDNEGRYTLNLNYIGSDGDNNYRFVIVSDNNSGVGAVPSSGDSVWINTAAKISDNNGAIQANSKNRRVILSIIWPPAKWTVCSSPNPFTPEVSELPKNIPDRSKGFGTAIRLRPTTSMELENIKAKCTIYDCLGNKVLESDLKSYGDSFYCVWDGYNKKHRLIGAGTYKLCVVINDGTKKTAINGFITVKR